AAALFADDTLLITAPRPSLTARSADEARLDLGRVPGGASLLEASSLTGKISTLKDAFDFVPGVFVQPRMGTMESRLSIRGSGLQRIFHLRGVAVYQDGIPLGLADGEGDLDE